MKQLANGGKKSCKKKHWRPKAFWLSLTFNLCEYSFFLLVTSLFEINFGRGSIRECRCWAIQWFLTTLSLGLKLNNVLVIFGIFKVDFANFVSRWIFRWYIYRALHSMESSQSARGWEWPAPYKCPYVEIVCRVFFENLLWFVKKSSSSFPEF